MKKLFTKSKKLSHKHVRELALMCGAMALLIVAAVFISGGGMERLNRVLALNHITPNSQAACTWGVFDCYNSSSIYSFTATPNPPPSGSNVTISWTSSSATYYCDGDILDSNGYMVPGTAWLAMGPNGSHVYPPISAPTTYTLQCNLNDYDSGRSPVWTLTVYPGASCAASSFGSPWNSNSYLIYSGGKGSISNWYGRYCLTNYSGSAIYIPMATPGEWNNFVARASAIGIGITSY